MILRRIRRGLLGLTLALGVVAATSGPAEAHADNNYAAWACGGTRPSHVWTVTHAHTVVYESTHLSASCIAIFGNQACSWVGTLWWNGALSHSAYQGDC